MNMAAKLAGDTAHGRAPGRVVPQMAISNAKMAATTKDCRKASEFEFP